MGVLTKEHDGINEKAERLGTEITMDLNEVEVNSKEKLREVQKDYATDQLPSKKKVYDMSPKQDVLV